MLNSFLAGAATISLLVIAMFFLRFWKRTHDRLFLFFAGAFLLMMVERIIRTVAGENEWAAYVYIVRLAAFILIIVAVLDKNRRI
jgi:cell division protein FtsW (lipid II flippase)